MKRGASPPPLPSLGGTGGGVSSSSVVAAATSVGGSAQKKKKHKTTMMTTKKKSFYSTGAANKNKTNATTKRHSREHYLREDIFCGIKQAPVEYKGKDETKDFGCGRKRRKEYEYKNTTGNAETRNEEKKDDMKSTIYVVDANVCLHQMDVLSHPKSMRNVVVCTTVLEEVRNRSRNAYERPRRLCLASSPSSSSDATTTRKNFFVFSNEFHKETYVGEAKKGESANDRNDRAIREVVKFYEKVVGLCSLNDVDDDDLEKRRKKRSCTKGYLNF